VNVKTFTSVVSDVSILSTVVDSLLIDFSSEFSDDSGLTDFVTHSVSVGDGVSSPDGSDSSGSLVEGEPLLDASWKVISDSELVLVVSNMLFVEQGSVGAHLGSDLESNSILEWLSWV